MTAGRPKQVKILAKEEKMLYTVRSLFACPSHTVPDQQVEGRLRRQSDSRQLDRRQSGGFSCI